MAGPIKERAVNALIWLVVVVLAVIATAGLLTFLAWITEPDNILTAWSELLGRLIT